MVSSFYCILQEKESLITELRKELRVSDEEHKELLSKVNADDTIRQIRSKNITASFLFPFSLLRTVSLCYRQSSVCCPLEWDLSMGRFGSCSCQFLSCFGCYRFGFKWVTFLSGVIVYWVLSFRVLTNYPIWPVIIVKYINNKKYVCIYNIICIY